MFVTAVRSHLQKLEEPEKCLLVARKKVGSLIVTVVYSQLEELEKRLLVVKEKVGLLIVKVYMKSAVSYSRSGH